MCEKIGLNGRKKENQTLLRNFLKIMMDNEADYTITFRNLSKVLFEDSDAFFNQFAEKKEINAWLNHWEQALKKEHKDLSNLTENLDRINPVYIPRNHQVQFAIDLAYENDFSKMLEMIEVFKNPFKEVSEYVSYSQAPLEKEKISRTFCGT